jgi:hypothetical protein
VLVPVYIELDEDCEQAARRSNFDVALDVLQTLKEQDEVLAELLREIVARKVKGYDDARLRDHVLFREPAIAPEVPLELLIEAIRVRCIDGLLSIFEQRWQENYQKTVRRKEECGDCNVPSYEDPELHRWQVDQRVKHKKRKLAPQRAKLLNDIGGFYWDADQAAWESSVQELAAGYARTGSWSIPQNTPLGRWMARVRLEFRKDELPQERIEQLHKMGFPWSGRELANDRWMKSFNELREFFQKNGNRKLGNDSKHKQFADHQRAFRKAGKLLKEREALLDGIRFPWNPHDEIWEEMFEKLCESIRTGSSPDKRLLSWMRNQRTEFTNGRLFEDRIKCLNGVGFCWDVRQELWRKRFEQLREYHREHGECLGHKAEKPLRSWIGIQRREYWRSVLSQEKIDLLNGIGFSWDPTGKRSVIPSADEKVT